MPAGTVTLLHPPYEPPVCMGTPESGWLARTARLGPGQTASAYIKHISNGVDTQVHSLPASARVSQSRACPDWDGSRTETGTETVTEIYEVSQIRLHRPCPATELAPMESPIYRATQSSKTRYISFLYGRDRATPSNELTARPLEGCVIIISLIAPYVYFYYIEVCPRTGEKPVEKDWQLIPNIHSCLNVRSNFDFSNPGCVTRPQLNTSVAVGIGCVDCDLNLPCAARTRLPLRPSYRVLRGSTCISCRRTAAWAVCRIEVNREERATLRGEKYKNIGIRKSNEANTNI